MVASLVTSQSRFHEALKSPNASTVQRPLTAAIYDVSLASFTPEFQQPPSATRVRCPQEVVSPWHPPRSPALDSRFEPEASSSSRSGVSNQGQFENAEGAPPSAAGVPGQRILHVGDKRVTPPIPPYSKEWPSQGMPFPPNYSTFTHPMTPADFPMQHALQMYTAPQRMTHDMLPPNLPFPEDSQRKEALPHSIDAVRKSRLEASSSPHLRELNTAQYLPRRSGPPPPPLPSAPLVQGFVSSDRNTTPWQQPLAQKHPGQFSDTWRTLPSHPGVGGSDQEALRLPFRHVDTARLAARIRAERTMSSSRWVSITENVLNNCDNMNANRLGPNQSTVTWGPYFTLSDIVGHPVGGPLGLRPSWR